MIEVQLDTIIDQLNTMINLLVKKDSGCCGEYKGGLPAPTLPEEHKVKTGPTTKPDPEPEATVAEYADMPLDILKRMCADRDIDVPPRTRATTMAKWLEDDDVVKKAAAKVEDTAAEAEVLDDDIADPFTEEEAADPFAEKEVTREMVIAKLQEVLHANGKTDVIDILKNEGGVLKVKDIPDNKMAAVYKSALRSLED